MFLNLLSELGSITAYTRACVTPREVKVIEQEQTISSISFQIHSSSQNTFGTHCSLQLKLMLRRRALDEFGLVYKTGMAFLRRAGEPCGNLPLCTKKLDNGYLRTGGG